MKKEIKILNSKDKKNLLKILNNQYNIKELPHFIYFYFGNDEYIYITNEESFNLDVDEMRTRHMGLNIGKISPEGFIFSIEGSQIFGKFANKNILNITNEEENLWILGEDLEKENIFNNNEIVLIKNEDDFLGCGIKKDKKIINLILKNRIQKKVFETE